MGIKISELPLASKSNNEDLFITVQDGATKKITKEKFLELVTQQLINIYTKTEADNLLNEKANQDDLDQTNGFVTNLTNRMDSAEANVMDLQSDSGVAIEISVDSNTYILTANLKNKAGNIVSTANVDLPLESLVKDIQYDSTTKEIIFILEDGTTRRVPIGDLISGLQKEITPQNKLSSDLVDDTNKTNKFVTNAQKTSWNAKYDKPNGGIPKNDLSNEVQQSLTKADTAIQDVTDKEDKSNKTTELTNESTDIQYPSAKAVYDSQILQDEKITDLEKEVEILSETVNSELEDGTSIGESITVNDSARAKAKLDIGGNIKQASIPDEYQAVEYIETDTNYNNQYIDTGVTATNTVEIDITFNTYNEFSPTFGLYGAIFGSRTNSKVQEYQLSTYSATGQQGIFRINNTEINAQLEREQKINVKIKDSKYYVNDVEKSTIDTTTTFNNNKNIYLFALNNNGNLAQHGHLKLYGCKIWKAGNLVREFIPVYRKSDNVAGLYDLVNEIFYTNQVTGNFLYGNNISIPNSDHEQPIHVLKGNNKILIQNKNLFVADWVKAYLTASGELYYIAAGHNSLGTVNYIKVTPNTQYKTSWVLGNKVDHFTHFFVSEYDKTHRHLGRHTGSTFTTKPNTEYIRVSWYQFSNAGKVVETDTNTPELFIKDVQLELGSTATDYEEHEEQSLELTLPEGMEMCNIEDYKDEFTKDGDNWIVPNKIQKIDSYNGETITTPYISSTGGLDIGATVYYVGTETLSITDTTLIEQLNALLDVMSYYGQTNVIVEAEDIPPIMTLNYKKSNRILRNEIDTIKARLYLLES